MDEENIKIKEMMDEITDLLKSGLMPALRTFVFPFKAKILGEEVTFLDEHTIQYSGKAHKLKITVHLE